MDALDLIVARAREGEADAFGILVRRFQDMAVGYGYSILHDFQLAEDAAQEAFFEAYRTLPKLREPAAFAGWFRRIVFKQCDRITRRRAIATVPLDSTAEPIHKSDNDEERKAEVFEAMRRLPEHERSAMTLFYIGGYSMEEVATFLEVPVSTVKGRLHSARERLRTMLFDTVADDLRARRPSRNESFATMVVDLLKAAGAGDIERVKTLLTADPRLLVARDPMGNTALIIAVNSGHDALADLLFDAGVEPGVHEAAAIGDSVRVRAALEQHPDHLDGYSPEGFTPLSLAAHFGHLEVMQLLIDRGADVNRVATNRLAVTPLHAALFGRQVDAARLLVEHGADVTLARGGAGHETRWLDTPPMSWWFESIAKSMGAANPSMVNDYAPDGFHPLGLAAFFGNKETSEALLQLGADVNQQSREAMKVSALHSSVAARRPDIAVLLLAKGANPNLRAEAGSTVFHGVAITGQIDLAEILLQYGADMNATDSSGKTPLAYALDHKKDAMAAWLKEHGGR